MLQDPRVDLLVGVLFIRDGIPVHWLILAHGQMDQSELSVVPHLTKLPLKVILVVAEEDLLSQVVAVRKLEDLGVEVLLLLGDQKSRLRYLDALRQDVRGVLREVEVVEGLLLKLTLLHVDDLCEEVVVCKG